jgi:outer membrane protein TolC
MGVDEYMGYGLAGIQLQWNLFDGLKRHAYRQQQFMQQEVVRERKKQMLEAWHNTLEQGSRQLMMYRQQFTASQASLEASRTLAEELKNAAAAGVATTADYLNAVTGQAAARLKAEQAKFLIKTATLQLKYAQGKPILF